MTNDDRIKMRTTAGATVRHFKRELDEHGIVRGTITI